MAQKASEKPSLDEGPAPAPVPWSLGEGQLATVTIPATDPSEVGKLHPTFFNVVQMATLHRLCGVLLPPISNRPGAVQAGTPEFLDCFIGESDSGSQELYRDGLDWLELSARKQFQRSFASVDDEQAGRLIRPWLRTWMTDHLPTERRAHFVNAVHADIRLATINSPAWDRALAAGGDPPSEKLYWLPVEPDVFKFRMNQQENDGSIATKA